ncbi:Uncharacterized protein Rs2_38060 [Raphanus sativus]|nr:Uncharacterized protein Rs2_38060 [Raphanus sativus]
MGDLSGSDSRYRVSEAEARGKSGFHRVGHLALEAAYISWNIHCTHPAALVPSGPPLAGVKCVSKVGDHNPKEDLISSSLAESHMLPYFLSCIEPEQVLSSLKEKKNISLMLKTAFQPYYRAQNPMGTNGPGPLWVVGM